MKNYVAHNGMYDLPLRNTIKGAKISSRKCNIVQLDLIIYKNNFCLNNNKYYEKLLDLLTNTCNIKFMFFIINQTNEINNIEYHEYFKKLLTMLSFVKYYIYIDNFILYDILKKNKFENIGFLVKEKTTINLLNFKKFDFLVLEFDSKKNFTWINQFINMKIFLYDVSQNLNEKYLQNIEAEIVNIYILKFLQ